MSFEQTAQGGVRHFSLENRLRRLDYAGEKWVKAGEEKYGKGMNMHVRCNIEELAKTPGFTYKRDFAGGEQAGRLAKMSVTDRGGEEIPIMFKMMRLEQAKKTRGVSHDIHSPSMYGRNLGAKELEVHMDIAHTENRMVSWIKHNILDKGISPHFTIAPVVSTPCDCTGTNTKREFKSPCKANLEDAKSGKHTTLGARQTANQTVSMYEFATGGTLTNWMQSSKHSVKAWWSALFQITMAGTVMKRAKMMHGDFHDENVLVLKVPQNSVLRYKVEFTDGDTKEYYVPTYGSLFMAYDFGFSYARESVGAYNKWAMDGVSKRQKRHLMARNDYDMVKLLSWVYVNEGHNNNIPKEIEEFFYKVLGGENEEDDVFKNILDEALDEVNRQLRRGKDGLGELEWRFMDLGQPKNEKDPVVLRSADPEVLMEYIGDTHFRSRVVGTGGQVIDTYRVPALGSKKKGTDLWSWQYLGTAPLEGRQTSRSRRRHTSRSRRRHNRGRGPRGGPKPK
jgi:hypothetical protein